MSYNIQIIVEIEFLWGAMVHERDAASWDNNGQSLIGEGWGESGPRGVKDSRVKSKIIMGETSSSLRKRLTAGGSGGGAWGGVVFEMISLSWISY